MSPQGKDFLLLACEKRNGYFVEVIPELTQLLGCNIAPYFLGNPDQAKSIIYYIIKHVTKDKASIAASLPLLKIGCENVLTYPSVAPNSGTDESVTDFLFFFHFLFQISVFFSSNF